MPMGFSDRFQRNCLPRNFDGGTIEAIECAKQRGLLSSVLHSFGGVISVGLMIPIFKKSGIVCSEKSDWRSKVNQT